MLTVLAVGTLRSAPAATLARDYVARTSRLGLRIRVEEIPQGRGGAIRNLPALLTRMGAATVSVALDERGEAPGSMSFARRLEADLARGGGDVIFVVGGAAGLPPEVVGSATRSLSLSSMTLPHELARVLLLEQIYRAATILRGTPYHRG